MLERYRKYYPAAGVIAGADPSISDLLPGSRDRVRAAHSVRPAAVHRHRCRPAREVALVVDHLFRQAPAHLQSAAVGVPHTRQEEHGDRKLCGVEDRGSRSASCRPSAMPPRPRCGCTTSSGRASRRRWARTTWSRSSPRLARRPQAAQMLDSLSDLHRSRRARTVRHQGDGRAHQAAQSARAEQAERLRAHARRTRAHRPPVSRRGRGAGAEHSRRRRPAEAKRSSRSPTRRPRRPRAKATPNPRASTARRTPRIRSFTSCCARSIRTRRCIDDKTTAILSSDSELLKVLTRGQGGAQ